EKASAGLLLFAAGAMLPMVATLAWFAPRTGIPAFVDANLLLNLRWKFRFSPLPGMRRIAVHNPVLVALAGAGLVRALGRLPAPGALARGDALLALQALGLLAGAFLIP